MAACAEAGSGGSRQPALRVVRQGRSPTRRKSSARALLPPFQVELPGGRGGPSEAAMTETDLASPVVAEASMEDLLPWPALGAWPRWQP